MAKSLGGVGMRAIGLTKKKFQTGLTGLLPVEHPHYHLRKVYERTLIELAKFPDESAYRRHTEAIVNQRLATVQEPLNKDVGKLERALDSGQIEEVIMQADYELQLTRRMFQDRVWEPLVTEAPPNQWKWPI